MTTTHETEIAKLTLQADTSEAVTAVNQLTEALERASEALTKLADHAHGGVSINVVGDLAQIEVKPAP